ncbi:MAG: hypothetical protein K8F91_07360, partial [Candidatus Obscuribacterales bacterium]|nr:hypothetical protein [Candidatus Obscuribacterales bacterium]
KGKKVPKSAERARKRSGTSCRSASCSSCIIRQLTVANYRQNIVARDNTVCSAQVCGRLKMQARSALNR